MGPVSELVDALRARDAQAFDRLLADDVVFNSPVATYSERAQVIHLLATIGRVLDTIEPARQIESEGVRATVIKGSYGDHALDGVLLQTLDGDGRITDLTLMLRPLEAQIAAVKRMGELLAEARERD
jgi:hypothetical protein